MNTIKRIALAALALALAGTGQAAEVAAEPEQPATAQQLQELQQLAADLEELTPEQRQELERRLFADDVQKVRELLRELGAAE